MLGGHAGLRSMEIAGLRWSNVDLGAGFIVVEGKGKRVRTVQLSSVLLKDLSELNDERQYLAGRRKASQFDDFVFRYRMTGHPYPPAHVSRIIREWISTVDGMPNYTAHQLRHRFATELLDATEDHRLVQSLLGHASINTLAVYAHVCSNRKREAINRMEGASASVGG